MRYFLEQRIIYESENFWRTRTDVRYRPNARHRGLPAVAQPCRLRLLGPRSAGRPRPDPAAEPHRERRLSWEVWLEYTTSGNDLTTIADDTIAYAQLRWRGRVWRDWLEYELRPAYTFVLDSDRDPFFSFFVSLTVLWDSYLGGSAGHPER